MARTLEGRGALIAGAGGGLGTVMALGLAEAGARFALHDLRPEAAAATAQAIGEDLIGEDPVGEDRALPLSGDIGERDECARAVAETVARFGRIDIVVNNAGVGIGTIQIGRAHV